MSAATLRALHRPGDPLVLPNVWDAASARVVAKAGFPAVATGSGAVSKALGHRDGHGTPVEEMLVAVARIVAAVDVPVTADMEGGYGLSPADLGARLIDTGAVGLNFEDTDHAAGGTSLLDTSAQADRIAALRAAAGDGLVINARVDVFLHGTADPHARLEEGMARARAYREAGADCVLPILADEDGLRAFVEQVDAPVNAFWQPDGSSLPRLAELGVARISFGSAIQRVALRAVEAAVTAIREGNTSRL